VIVGSDPVRNILLIGVARIGDTLLLTPAMRALKQRYPSARLTVLAHPKRREVLENLDFIDCLAGVTKKTAWFKGRFPGRAFDLCFVYGRDEALVGYAQRVCHQVYCYDETEFSALPDTRLVRVQRPQGGHAVHERLALVEAAGAVATDYRLGYQVTAAERQSAEVRLNQHGLAGRRPRIGLQAFSFPTKAHRDWPLENFAHLIESLTTVHPEAIFLVLGDAQAAILAKPLAERFPGCVEIVAGNQSLRASAAMMSLLDLYVGVDTGPTHIAGALGIPMIALYHHQYPGRNLAPLQNANCHVIEHPATLSGNAGELSGMGAIPAAEIVELALATLACSGSRKV
jgi:heptosyltransferase-3